MESPAGPPQIKGCVVVGPRPISANLRITSELPVIGPRTCITPVFQAMMGHLRYLLLAQSWMRMTMRLENPALFLDGQIPLAPRLKPSIRRWFHAVSFSFLALIALQAFQAEGKVRGAVHNEYPG